MPDQLDNAYPASLAPWTPKPEGSGEQNQGPLAQFQGRTPPAPAWFTRAIAVEPERSTVRAAGANIELLAWGERGRPGLIFVHGNSAHADWWSFIAPLLAEDFRVAALSLSGMGDSDWREDYSFETFAEETWVCAKAAGLYDAEEKPIYVGHSFGGSQVYYSARRYPERMKAAILVDTGFGGPPPRMMEQQREAREAALARFRFMPPQSCSNFYIADFIARRSLKRAPLADGGGEGWTWKFDPFLFGKLNRSAMQDLPESPGAPLVHIYGERSNVMKRSREGQPNPLPDDIPHIIIPDSDHHIMIDQPLALVSALRGVLATWKPA
jgi:pimeloyl-ACP methyl ester carboxylesterase